MRQVITNSLVLLCSTVICIMILEGGVRIIGQTDSDDNFTFTGKAIYPQQQPVKKLSSIIQRLKAMTNNSPHKVAFVYDENLGWTANTSYESDDSEPSQQNLKFHAGGYRIGRLQTETETDKARTSVCLFGDSFTMGAEVPFEDSWGYQLQQSIKQDYPNLKVFNFGIVGYGIGQAYLRWQKVNQYHNCEITIFGFAPTDVKRGVNLIRLIRSTKTSVPYSKPRFIIKDKSLQLINQPSLEPEEVLQILKDIESWPLIKHEYYYNPAIYSGNILDQLRIVGVIKRLYRSRTGQSFSLKYSRNRVYHLEGEPTQVALQTIEKWADEAESENQKFITVHLPNRRDLDEYSQKELIYKPLLDEISRQFLTIDPIIELTDFTKTKDIQLLFKPGGHYSATGSQIVASKISEKLIEHLNQVTIKK
jgi:hypothetical protein